MARAWYVEAGGRVDGPLSTRELRAWAAAGRLRPADRVSRDRRKWVPASRIKGLAFAPETATPHATVPATPPPAARTVVCEDPLLPGYELLGRVGAGSCGVVWKARQLQLDRVVAVKTVAVDPAKSRTAAARFEREALALAQLRHPNIVQVYDAGRVGGRVFFAMELLDGEDLDRRVARAGPLDEHAAWWVARQTAAALAHAAGHGISHRDVKPANLVLTPPPTGFALPPGVPLVKVTDFGLAHTAPPAGDPAAGRLTANGVIVGTPVYMAPEQFATPDVGPRADIYALGATVFHALAGRPPFDAPTIWDVMVRKVETFPRLGPPVSAESAELVAAMMATDPAERVADYDELLARIDALPVMRAGSGERAAVAAPAAPRRRRWLLAGGVGWLAVAAGTAAVAWPGRGQPGPEPAAAPAGRAEFVSTGRTEELFNGQTMLGWTPAGGQAWELVRDEEKTPVLTGAGAVRRAFHAFPSYRLIVGLDLYKAAAAEVTVAVPDGPDAPRYGVRLTRAGGAVFGKRAGAGGAFEPAGAGVPLPSAAELDGKSPYLEVRCDRAGGRWRVWFRGKPLGDVPDDGGPAAAELRVAAEGGPVRLDSARLEELRPK
jgi:hypothetical protein